MKNIFLIQTNRTTKTTKEEYEPFILRKLTKKQTDKINSMSQKYNVQRKKGDLPQGLYILDRVFFTATLMSFIFLIVSLIFDARKGMQEFFKTYLWILIIFLVSVFCSCLLKGIVHWYRKRKKSLQAKKSAEEIFQSILNVSKDFLSVPKTAECVEVLMEQQMVKAEGQEDKNKSPYSNVILSVFLEKGMLCFADLYLVLGIPLSSIAGLEKINHPYVFKFWHRKEKPSIYPDLHIHPVSRPVRGYQGDYYYELKILYQEKEYAIFFPAYEKEKWDQLFSSEKEVNL